jgi:DNA-directed RNA polymerase subunit RPC12/RpoP
MAMVCPKCNRSFEQQLECPTCGVRLLYHAKIRPNGDDPSGLDGQ